MVKTHHLSSPQPHPSIWRVTALKKVDSEMHPSLDTFRGSLAKTREGKMRLKLD